MKFTDKERGALARNAKPKKWTVRFDDDRLVWLDDGQDREEIYEDEEYYYAPDADEYIGALIRESEEQAARIVELKEELARSTYVQAYDPYCADCGRNKGDK